MVQGGLTVVSQKQEVPPGSNTGKDLCVAGCAEVCERGGRASNSCSGYTTVPFCGNRSARRSCASQRGGQKVATNNASLTGGARGSWVRLMRLSACSPLRIPSQQVCKGCTQQDRPAEASQGQLPRWCSGGTPAPATESRGQVNCCHTGDHSTGLVPCICRFHALANTTDIRYCQPVIILVSSTHRPCLWRPAGTAAQGRSAAAGQHKCQACLDAANMGHWICRHLGQELQLHSLQISEFVHLSRP